MVLEKSSSPEVKELFQKFCARYSEDLELVKICDAYDDYLKSREPGKLTELKSSLERLKSTRSFGGSGTTNLWFKDRRPDAMQMLQIA